MSVVKPPEQSVAQPTGQSAAQRAVQEFANREVVLHAGEQGLSVNGELVEEAALQATLSRAIADSAEGNLKIKVGNGVAVQRLVELIDAAQVAGAKDVQIAAE